MQAPRPKGSAYEAWLAPLTAKYPDLRTRTSGEYGWTSLGVDDNGPTLTPAKTGPHWTDVSSRSYSTGWLLGSFDHNSNSGEYFIPVEVPVDALAD